MFQKMEIKRYELWSICAHFQIQVLIVQVVVGMSAGVDPLVNGLLFAKNVWKKKLQKHIQNLFQNNECLIAIGFSTFCGFCVELGRSRRTGTEMRMVRILARCSISVQETWSSFWTCVCVVVFFSSVQFCNFHPFKLIYHRSIGIGFSNHRWGSESWESVQIQRFGATSSLSTHWDATSFYTDMNDSGEIKFGANSLPTTNLTTMYS